MWIEPRSASAKATSKLKANSHLFPGSQALSVPVLRFPTFNRAVAYIFALTTCDVYIFRLSNPIPVSPSTRFCLA